MTTILVTGATGDTGRPTAKELLKKGFRVRALARREDARSRELAALGAEIVYGDMMSLRDIRLAMEGVERAYFCFPLAEGLVEAGVIFAQAAKEQNVGHIVNLSHKQSRPDARSKATQNHWLSEQVFDWSGIPTTHLRVTFFAEWLLYISSLIQRGRYVMPYNRKAASRRWPQPIRPRSSPTSWKSRKAMAAKPTNCTARRNTATRSWPQRSAACWASACPTNT